MNYSLDYVWKSFAVLNLCLYFFELRGGLVERNGDEILLTPPPSMVVGSFTLGEGSQPWKPPAGPVSKEAIEEAKRVGDLAKYIERAKGKTYK